MKRKDDAGQSFDVGYAKPPVAHRFKPGQSGNPQGRPKKPTRAKADVEALWRIMEEKITIREGTKTRTVSKLEAAIRNLIVNGIKGDPKALEMMLKAAKRQGMLQPQHGNLLLQFAKSDGKGGTEIMSLEELRARVPRPDPFTRHKKTD